MDHRKFFKAFIVLLLIATYCETKPLETITENIATADTTICPEELAKQNLENADTTFDETENLHKESLLKADEEYDSRQPSTETQSEEIFDEITATTEKNILEGNLNTISEGVGNTLQTTDLLRTRNNENEKQSLTEISDVTTTICPEELERSEENSLKTSQEGVDLLNVEKNENAKQTATETPDQPTTICPKELERKKLEESSIETTQESQSSFQEVNLLNVERDDGATQASTENSDQSTTECPEEVELKNLEDNSTTTPQDSQDILQKEDLETVEGERHTSTEISNEATTICPEELERQKHAETTQDIVHTEAEPTTVENNEHLPQSSTANSSDETTTICPEELENQSLEPNSTRNTQATHDVMQQENEVVDQDENRELLSMKNIDETTTICAEELENLEENSNDKSDKDTLQIDSSQLSIVKDAEDVKPNKEISNYGDDSNTLCPEELARIKLEKSQQYLNKYKELISRVQNGKVFRKKRQVSSYSPYYVNQPNYNSQGVAVSNGISLNQQQSSYNPQALSASNFNQNQPSYNSQRYNSQNYNSQGGLSASNTNGKTFQQIQRQYQTAPKPQKIYQNKLKPVNNYRNPSTYVRYSNNGNLKNNYRVNSAVNRRQFQGPVSSSTARPIVTRKKKFRPSPVFA